MISLPKTENKKPRLRLAASTELSRSARYRAYFLKGKQRQL